MPLFKFNPQERGTQLHFFDDSSFEFRKLLIEDSFLVEKNPKGDIIRAWVMPYKLQKRFPGFKNIGSDMVSLSYNRNIVLDLFHQLTDSEKPVSEQGKFKKGFITQIAESKCYQHEQKAKTSLATDKITLFMITLATLFGLVIGITAVY